MAFLYDGESTLYWTGMIVLTAVLYLRYYKKKGKLPPGPVGLPILGCYLSLRKDPIKAIAEMGHKYGNVFGFYLGTKYLVVLNDWDATTDALSQSASLSRPPTVFGNVPYNLGIAGNNGPTWLYERRLTSKAMKDVGLHQTRWEEAVQEEVTEIVEWILKHGNGPLDVKNFFLETFTSNITTLALGERLPVGHPDTKVVAKAVDNIIQLSPTLGISNFSPTLGKILEVLGFEKKSQIQKLTEDVAKFVSDTVDGKIQNPDKESENSFIDKYHFEILNSKKAEMDNKYAEFSIKGNFLVLLTGGSETSLSSTIWSLIAMADHPEKQEKVHEELVKVLGKDGCMKWSDRMKIPYTYAALLESTRWRTLIPFSTMRMAAEDMIVQGYHIPKGSYITSNFWAIHNDPRYWKDPEEFLPERFLLENGKVNGSPDSYCPFSYGKRNCPGKLIALMANLQYFTSLMQKFKVVPKDGKKVKYNTFLGLTYQAENTELCFIPRQ